MDDNARQTNEIRNDATVNDKQYVGIRGWLILPAVELVLNFIYVILSLVWIINGISSLSRIGRQSDQIMNIAQLFVLTSALCLVLSVFLIYVATRFFGKRRNAPSMMICWFVLSVILSGFMCLVFNHFAATGSEFLKSISAEVNKHFLTSFIKALIWIPYFRVSKRVKATFVN